MNAGAKMLRSLMLAGILISAATGVARAATGPVTCTNDIQCVAVPGCGGEVCDFIATQKCIAATGAPQTGWCTVTSDCKCAAQGATCEVGYCTFTTPKDGGTSTGTAGTTAGTGGSTGTAGAGGSTAGTAGAGAAGAGGTKSTSSGGGCSVASSTSGGFAALIGLALVVGGLARRRRRA